MGDTNTLMKPLELMMMVLSGLWLGTSCYLCVSLTLTSGNAKGQYQHDLVQQDVKL